MPELSVHSVDHKLPELSVQSLDHNHGKLWSSEWIPKAGAIYFKYKWIIVNYPLISIHQIFLKIILNQHLRNIYLERILKVFKYININLRTDINVKYLLPFSISLITNYIAFTNFSINVPCFPFHVDCNI